VQDPTAPDVFASANSTDLLARTARRFEGDRPHPGFSVHGHEFGHTLGREDEYDPDKPAFDDTESIMNVGRHLRSRHLKLICQTLGAMIPGCMFVPLLPRKRRPLLC
jgi:hypothetical protein